MLGLMGLAAAAAARRRPPPPPAAATVELCYSELGIPPQLDTWTSSPVPVSPVPQILPLRHGC